MMTKRSLSIWHLAFATTIILITLTWQLRIIKNNWTQARGYEQEWVADSLVNGYGYSFDPTTAWLGPYNNRTAYSPTAWVEPVYTLVIAAALKIFGEYGRLILTLFNVVWLGASAVMVFLLVGEILDYKLGIFTSLIFLIVHACKPVVILYIGNAALAGFLYCLTAYLLLRCLKNSTLTNAVFLGAVIGIANLNHAGSLLFAPLLALVLLLGAGFRKGAAWRISLVLLITTIVLLSPWILRNYLVFGKFVPVRSGFGYQLYIGNPGLARTFTPGPDFDASGRQPPWTADSPRQALHLLRDLKYDAALADHSIDVVSEDSSADYPAYNEVERDRVFLVRSLAFIRTEPLLSIEMVFWKAMVFLSFGQNSLKVVSLGAILGGLLLIRDVRVASLLVLVAGYTLPYIFSLPLYYRYRSPIEPMLFVLAGFFLGICLQSAGLFQRRFMSYIAKEATN